MNGFGQYQCFYSNISPLALLLAARDFIHAGWKLVHHPLYGNFRPSKQPYRSLILCHRNDAVDKSAGFDRVRPDDMSLHLIEEAITVYTGSPVLEPGQAPDAFKDACSLLDYELMRQPLCQSGWPLDVATAEAL